MNSSSLLHVTRRPTQTRGKNFASLCTTGAARERWFHETKEGKNGTVNASAKWLIHFVSCFYATHNVLNLFTNVYNIRVVGLPILTALVMRSSTSISRDKTPCIVRNARLTSRGLHSVALKTKLLHAVIRHFCVPHCSIKHILCACVFTYYSYYKGNLMA